MMKKIILLFSIIFPTISFSADDYRIPAGGSLFVSEHGYCAEISNNYSSDLFVPTKTALQFRKFVTGSASGKVSSYQGCSCSSLFQMGNFTSGNYSLDPDGAGPLAPYTAYCDMVTDGGGWTLVGRSVGGTPNTHSFGWKYSTGSVTDDSLPYSLGVTAAQVKFSEIMFGNYTSAKNWGGYVYKHQNIPQDFLTTYGADQLYPNSPLPVLGGNTVFGMAARTGYTDRNTSFFFRDMPEETDHGLNWDQWWTSYGTDYGGYILGQQGMVMVR